MSDSDARPEQDANDEGVAVALHQQVLEDFEDEIADDLATLGAQQPLLTGPTTVTLSFTVHDASTPQEAVNMAVHTVASVGYDAFFFQVYDQEADRTYHVRAGQLVDLADDPGGS